jgi:hypothetical protein
MEFLLYLSPAGKDIYSLVSQKVRVVENAPICRKHEIYGWYNNDERTITICTDTIKKGSDPNYYINETLFHEATHIAQSCKYNMRGSEPFWIHPSKMPITQRRKDDIEAAKKIVGNSVHQVEHEAFWMEDKPEKVEYVLRKFCF